MNIAWMVTLSQNSERVHMNKKIAAKQWHWSCGWHSTNFGRFHPDYECCNAHSRNPFKTEASAALAGKKHFETHRYSTTHGGSIYIWRNK